MSIFGSIVLSPRSIPATRVAFIRLTTLLSTPVETGTEAALTDKQQATLVLAYERGYFESPREVTMGELGDEFGISQQAVASRLRNGIKNSLNQTLPETKGAHH